MLIAQLSDIHAAPDNDNLVRLHRVIDWLRGMQPDLLVVSGDLTDEGWHEGYRAIDTELKRLACPVRMLPGNADDKAVMCASLADFAHRDPTQALHFSEYIKGVPVIGVDVTIEGASGGDIRPHLAWLETALGAYPQPAMIFLHQHLFPSGIAPLDNAMCEGADALKQLLARLPFPPLALCCGHVHRAMCATIAGIPAYSCASICPANPLMLELQTIPAVTDPAGILIHTLHHDACVSHFVSV